MDQTNTPSIPDKTSLPNTPVKKDQKKLMIAVAGLVLLLLIGGFIALRGRTGSNSGEQGEDILTNEVIPTVDASVKVDLTSEDGKEVMLTINGIPEGTESIEYELSYFNSDNNPKGVIGTINTEGETEVERSITLGTCSSGTCVYDEGVESIKVSLKFNGSYGARIFEKEFEL